MYEWTGGPSLFGPLVRWDNNHGIISCCEEAAETYLLIAQHVYALQLELQYKQLISTFTVYVCLRVNVTVPTVHFLVMKL